VNDLPSYMRGSFDAEGHLIADRRLSIRHENGGWTASCDSRIARFATPDECLSWLVNQPPPSQSLRLGNLVHSITNAAGIAPCNQCKLRQLKFNAVRMRGGT